MTPEQNCVPFYGVIYITSAANTDSAAATKLDVSGLDCDPSRQRSRKLSAAFAPNLPMSLTKTSHPSISMTDFGTVERRGQRQWRAANEAQESAHFRDWRGHSFEPSCERSRVPSATTPAAAISTPVTRPATASTPVPPTHVTPPTATPETSVPSPLVAVDDDSRDTNPGSPGYGRDSPGDPTPVTPTPTAPAPATPDPVSIKSNVPAAVAATAVSPAPVAATPVAPAPAASIPVTLASAAWTPLGQPWATSEPLELGERPYWFFQIQPASR